MTEAFTCETRNSGYDPTQNTTHEMTPDSDEKHSASSDSPAETTGGDFDGSSSAFRHDDDEDVGVVQDNVHKSSSSNMTEIKARKQFLSILSNKNEEIKRLITENKHLRSLLSENDRKAEVRVKELVEELERHAELVERHQNQLDNTESQLKQKQQQIVALKQQLHRTQQQLRSAVLQQNQQHQQHVQHNVKSNTQKKEADEIEETATASDSGLIGEFSTSSGVCNNNSNGNSDEVYAALNAFIEKNRNDSAALAAFSPNAEADNVTHAIVEYLNKLIGDNNTSQMDSDEANNLITLLLNTENNTVVNNNNGLDYGNCKNNRSPKSTYRCQNATVRDVISAGAGRTSTSNSEQPFYRGSAASSASSSATGGSLSGTALQRSKFSQHFSGVNAISTPNSESTYASNVATRPAPSSSTTNGSVLKAFSTTAPTTSNTPPSSSSSNAKPLSEEEQHIISQMQDRVAVNVARLGNCALNTFVIANQCKRLMTAYNIGQRLFAKAVMCQVVKSQGSLSELLSKPRAWHKLTDKGREAFRRIYGWLSDDVAIELLCQLSPRRVAMPGDRIEHPQPDSLLDHGDSALYEADFQASRTAGGSGFDESVSNLLSSTIPNDDEDLKHATAMSLPSMGLSSPCTTTSSVGCPSPTALHKQIEYSLPAPNVRTTNGATAVNIAPTFANNSSGNSRWRHDDIPREKIIGILEAEKAKLREQEKPRQNAQDAFASNGASGDSTPNSPRAGLYGRGIRAEPTPINQDQFEKYPVLDTEEVVKQVKDYLSRHSVSQRQFGDAVLGLSQGSVSDLLARPKAWSMLTHKGREPFIRMRIFLDEHANDEKPPAGLHGIGFADKADGLNFGMEEECRDTPEPDVLYRTLLDHVKSERSNVEDGSENASISQPKTPQQVLAESIANATTNRDTTPKAEESLDTRDLCRRVKEFLTQNAISQRAFGEHVLNMTSGTVSDLLSRPKSWNLLSSKGRESYMRMLHFLEDEKAMNVLRVNAAARNSSHNNLNNNNNNADMMTVRELLSSNAGSTVAPTPANCATPTSASATAEYITSPLPVTAFASSPSSGNKFSQMLLDHSRQQQQPSTFHQQQLPSGLPQKRKLSSLDVDYGDDSVGSYASGKKIPRFQRTIITDQQKEALFFIFSHEQRPSAKMIDQLAIHLGLSSRTVTNWFHNYRTRQKAKETKLASEAAAKGLPPPPIKPNPLQVADPTTKPWYSDLSKMLAQNISSSGISGIEDIHNANDLFNHSGYSSLLDSTIMNGDNANSDSGDEGGNLTLDSMFIHHEGDDYGSDYGSGPTSGSAAGGGYGINANGNGSGGVELEEEEESGSEQRTGTPKSSCSGVYDASTNNCSQLDKAIARIHNRLTR